MQNGNGPLLIIHLFFFKKKKDSKHECSDCNSHRSGYVDSEGWGNLVVLILFYLFIFVGDSKSRANYVFLFD